MRTTTIAAVLTLLIIAPMATSAECRRSVRPGGAFGIDDGDLCSFGNTDGPVLPVEPQYGNEPNPADTDSLWTYQERRNMLRGVVTKNRSASNGLLNQAINGAYRPLGGTSRRLSIRGGRR